MRIRRNSIRLRLTQSEVAQVVEQGFVEETVEFGGENKLIYSIKTASDAEIVSARFDSNQLIVSVPRAEIERWANSNQVAVKAEQNVGNAEALRLLIEKDFACLEPRGDEDADAFPNPAGNLKC